MSDRAWLIDKSAMVRLGNSADAELWFDRVQRGLVYVCLATVLEVGYSATSAADWTDKIRREPLSLMPLAGITPAAESRAIEVQGALAARGQHRAPSIPDLLIASVAEVSSLTVLHVDQDFDLIAEVTGQAVERLLRH